MDPEVYAYIESSLSSSQIRNELAKTYDDKGGARKVTLLQEVSTTRLENYKSMEDYVSRIISASKKHTAIGAKLPDELVGALVLAGLPAEYKSMVMTLTSSGKDVTADLVKTKLLDEPDSNITGSPFQSRGFFTHASATQFTRRGRGG